MAYMVTFNTSQADFGEDFSLESEDSKVDLLERIYHVLRQHGELQNAQIFEGSRTTDTIERSSDGKSLVHRDYTNLSISYVPFQVSNTQLAGLEHA